MVTFRIVGCKTKSMLIQLPYKHENHLEKDHLLLIILIIVKKIVNSVIKIKGKSHRQIKLAYTGAI